MLKQVTLTIPETMYQRAEILAKQTHRQLEELLAQSIVLEHVYQNGAASSTNFVDLSEPNEALDREQEAYIMMHPELKKHYLGQHVAVYGGQLIDHDTDYGALYERMVSRYPNETLWITTVKDEPIPTLVMRSPRFVRRRRSNDLHV